MFACFAMEAVASAALTPVVESKGAFVKISVTDAPAVGQMPALIYIRRDAIVSITILNGGEKESGLPFRVIVATSALSTEGKSYSYRFSDQASALKFCDAVASEPKG